MAINGLFSSNMEYDSDGAGRTINTTEYAAMNKTEILKSGKPNNEVLTLYTVPDGQNLYLSHAFLQSLASGTIAELFYEMGGLSGTILLLNQPDPVIDTAPIVIQYNMPLKLTAGATVKLMATKASTNTAGYFGGWIDNY